MTVTWQLGYSYSYSYQRIPPPMTYGRPRMGDRHYYCQQTLRYDCHRIAARARTGLSLFAVEEPIHNSAAPCPFSSHYLLCKIRLRRRKAGRASPGPPGRPYAMVLADMKAHIIDNRQGRGVRECMCS
eukprot:scaffold17147_cov28-Prasinocladus_malaysianus.AAC.1